MSDETARNSEVIPAIRPDELMEELGIKKSAYHEDLKFLGIKPQKDSNGKCFLEKEEADKLRALRSWISEHGKRAGFVDSNSENKETIGKLAITEENTIASTTSFSDFDPPEQKDPYAEIDHDALYREASEIAAFNMTVGQQVVLSLANQLSYDDLHPEAKQKVDNVRSAASPKAQPQAIAAKLLDKIRSQRSETQQEAVEAA